MSYKWNYTVYNPLALASFIQCNSLESHSDCCMYVCISGSFLFYHGALFHDMDGSQFNHSLMEDIWVVSSLGYYR